MRLKSPMSAGLPSGGGIGRAGWLPGVLAVALAFTLLAWGLGPGAVVTRDSLGYFGMAESWRAEGSLFTVRWPPGYPLLLALAQAGGAGLARAATLINLAAYALTGALAVLLVRAPAGPRAVLGVGGLLVLIASSVVLDAHRFALTEPLFMTCQMAVCLGTVDYLTRGHLLSLLGAGLLAGASIWVRYAGVFLIPAVVLAPWFQNGMRARGRWVHAIIVAGAIASMCAGLALTLAVLCPGGVPRGSVWHAVSAEHVRQLGTTVLGWVLPSRWVTAAPALQMLGAVAAVVLPPGLAIGLWRRHRLAAWFAAQAALYLLGLVASICLADHSTPLDARVLLPYYAALVLCGLAAGAVAETWPIRRAIALILLAAGVLGGVRSWRYLSGRRLAEEGYDTPAWRSDPVVALLRELPPDWTLIGNPGGALQFHAGRAVGGIPRRYDTVQARESDGIAELRRRFGARNPARTLMVWYPSECDERDMSPDDTAEALGLVVRTNYGRAVLYTHAGLPVKRDDPR